MALPAERSRPDSRHEPLATLGDSLALFRMSTSASGFVGGTFDVGAYETERFYLLEVDANGRQRRAEVFAADRLGVAVARLYERYADLLPDGPARIRAAATARSVAAMLGRFDRDRYCGVLAPRCRVASTTGSSGRSHPRADPKLIVRGLRLLFEMADDRRCGVVDDILALQPDATPRAADQLWHRPRQRRRYERQFLQLWVFGADGLADAHRDFRRRSRRRGARPLRRADGRASGGASRGRAIPSCGEARAPGASERRDRERRPRRRRDRRPRRRRAAYPARRRVRVVDHTTGVTFDRQGALSSMRSLLRRPGSDAFSHEPLATLGDSLALFRVLTSASGFVGGTFDVGAYEISEISPDRGRRERTTTAGRGVRHRPTGRRRRAPVRALRRAPS